MDHLLELTRQAEARHFWFQGFRRFVEPVVAELASGGATTRWLDCGCGTGANMTMLARHGSVTGFDLSGGGISTARERGLAVARGDITRIPIASNSADIVTAFDVLQCVPDDVAAVREMARVVEPGGAVVVTLAAFSFLGGDHGEVWGEVRRYTPSTARALLEQAGLRTEQVSFMFASIFPVMLAARLAQRVTRPFRRVSDRSDIQVPSGPVNLALGALVRMEAVVRRYVPMPVGSSLLVVARKPT